MLIRRAGKIDRPLLDLILANVRTPVEREGDLMAQLMALHRGELRLLELVAKYGEARVQRNMRELEDYSERMMRAALRALPRGVYRFEDYLEGASIQTVPAPFIPSASLPSRSRAIARRSISPAPAPRWTAPSTPIWP